MVFGSVAKRRRRRPTLRREFLISSDKDDDGLIINKSPLPRRDPTGDAHLFNESNDTPFLGGTPSRIACGREISCFEGSRLGCRESGCLRQGLRVCEKVRFGTSSNGAYENGTRRVGFGIRSGRFMHETRGPARNMKEKKAREKSPWEALFPDD